MREFTFDENARVSGGGQSEAKAYDGQSSLSGSAVAVNFYSAAIGFLGRYFGAYAGGNPKMR